ncbi:MAG: excinuclease ABC subunit UvrA [Phycisphaerales bacterium]|nr:excinuclease ABC subunit UvrA [Phycisphaerales bacterium]
MSGRAGVDEAIELRGAYEHNLRGVSLRLPKNRLICFTGVSGSGKSSLAFDTLFAEGQRRYIESLSAYARQFLDQLPKPNVEHVSGLSPSIAIQQKTSGWNPRSTVGTITQIHDFLRVLFARIGRQHCPQCKRPIRAQTREEILTRVLSLAAGTRVLILAPLARGQKGEFADVMDDLRRQGFARARVDGRVINLSDAPALARNARHNVDVVVDRLTVAEGVRSRLAEAVESALKLGKGTMIALPVEREEEAPPSADRSTDRSTDRATDRPPARAKGRKWVADAASESVAPAREMLLSSEYACVDCGISFEPPTPQMLSFNSPQGMCRRCEGLGRTFDFDPDLLVPNPSLSFLDLAVEPMRVRIGKWRRHVYRGVAEHVGFDLKAKWCDLPARAKQALLYGTGDEHLTFEWRTRGGVFRHGGKFEGVVAELQRNYRKATSAMVRAYYEKYMRETTCPDCRGGRLNAQAMELRINGRSIVDVCGLSISGADAFVDALELQATEKLIAEPVVREVRMRLRFLLDVGLEYLSLDRAAPTLSGGESQRIRLASQIGSGLTGALYILDEPSIGLHARDNRRLIASLQRLRDMGNTVVVVEHDEETMRAADRLVDFGPGPGVRGGKVVAEGGLETLAAAPDSLTGQYLSGRRRIEIPKARRPVSRAKPVVRKPAVRKPGAPKPSASRPAAARKRARKS